MRSCYFFLGVIITYENVIALRKMRKTVYHEHEPDQFAFEQGLWCVMLRFPVVEARGSGANKKTD